MIFLLPPSFPDGRILLQGSGKSSLERKEDWVKKFDRFSIDVRLMQNISGDLPADSLSAKITVSPKGYLPGNISGGTLSDPFLPVMQLPPLLYFPSAF